MLTFDFIGLLVTLLKLHGTCTFDRNQSHLFSKSEKSTDTSILFTYKVILLTGALDMEMTPIYSLRGGAQIYMY